MEEHESESERDKEAAVGEGRGAEVGARWWSGGEEGKGGGKRLKGEEEKMSK